MRVLSKEELVETLPPELRENSKQGQVYIGLRKKIILGEYEPHHLLSAKELESEYQASNTSVQMALMRLASEGLVDVFPVKKKTRATSAMIAEYRVADLNVRHRMLTTRHGDFVEDVKKAGYPARKETLILKVAYADAEIAHWLHIEEGDKVIFHRNLQKSDEETVICINDQYLPFWFVEMMPELEKPESDVYELMRVLGKNPFWCTETVDVMQANSVERKLFGLAFDDPMPMFKILRRSFDEVGNPLEVQFLTDVGKVYRLHYSFPLYPSGIPEAVRDK